MRELLAMTLSTLEERESKSRHAAYHKTFGWLANEWDSLKRSMIGIL